MCNTVTNLPAMNYCKQASNIVVCCLEVSLFISDAQV